MTDQLEQLNRCLVADGKPMISFPETPEETLGARIRARRGHEPNSPWSRPAVQEYRSGAVQQSTSSRSGFTRVSFEDAQSMFHRPTS